MRSYIVLMYSWCIPGLVDGQNGRPVALTQSGRVVYAVRSVLGECVTLMIMERQARKSQTIHDRYISIKNIHDNVEHVAPRRGAAERLNVILETHLRSWNAGSKATSLTPETFDSGFC